MQYKTLGDTGLLVSTLCFGTMTFHGGTGLFRAIGTVDQAGADQLIKASIEGGINFFDTADVYSEGESERTLGQSLKNLNIARNSVIIATKVFGRTGPGRNEVGASRGHIMDAVDASLRRLQTDHIDLYQIHANASLTPIDETPRAPDPPVQQGKVRHIGVSNGQSWKLAKALAVSEFKNLARFDTLQAYYSIAGRDLERDLVPLLEAEKTGFLVWSPLAGGLLSGKFSRENQKPAGSRRSEFGFPIVDKERTWRILDVMTPMAARQTCRHIHHHRSQTPRSAQRQRCRRRPQTWRRRAQATRRSQCPATRVPRLDAPLPKFQSSRTRTPHRSHREVAPKGHRSPTGVPRYFNPAHHHRKINIRQTIFRGASLCAPAYKL